MWIFGGWGKMCGIRMCTFLKLQKCQKCKKVKKCARFPYFTLLLCFVGLRRGHVMCEGEWSQLF